MGFYQIIKNQYGYLTVQQLKKWANYNIKLASNKNRKIFLLQCRSNGITPKHIYNNTKNIKNLISVTNGRTANIVNNFNENLNHKILNLEISINHGHIKWLEKSQSILENQILQNLPINIWTEFKRRQNLTYNRTFNKIKNNNIAKIQNLKEIYHRNIKVKDTWIKNLSNIIIPKEILDFLALGFKFALSPTINDISIEKLLSDIELIIENFDEKTKNIFRAQVTNIITNFIHKPPQIDYYNYLFKKTKDFFKEHPNIFVTRSDKGNVTVIISKDLYQEKCFQILTDVNNYQRLNKDPTSSFQQKANKIVANLKSNNYILDNEAKKLTIYNQTAPKFYGLPKIHKPTLSVRPIVSSINAPNSKLAEFVTDILTKAYDNNNDYYVKDSFHFALFINERQLPTNYVNISLDVVSLFSNIPLELVISSIEKRWDNITQYTKIPFNKFLDLIKFIFSTSYCLYNGTYYQQIMGTPMGATISPIIAQYVMDDLLDFCLPKLSFQVNFLKKFVDDIVCALPENKIDEISNIFNQYNPHIQFTIEKETAREIPFLDTKLIRNDQNKILLDWYTKSVHSGRYMNYHSCHPVKMKINLVLALKNRVEKLSHRSFLKTNIDKLYNILRENSYPEKFLKKLLYNTISGNLPVHNSITENIQIDNQENITSYFASIPYIKSVSSKIVNVFKNENIKITQKFSKTIKNLHTKLKDKDVIEKKSNVVYSISCSSCEAIYIGQTSRVFKDRLTSHKSDIRLNKQTCALSEHKLDFGHFPNYNDIKILHTESNLSKRLFLEMVEIKKENKSINKRKDINDLSNIYSYLINFCKRKAYNIN